LHFGKGKKVCGFARLFDQFDAERQNGLDRGNSIEGAIGLIIIDAQLRLRPKRLPHCAHDPGIAVNARAQLDAEGAATLLLPMSSQPHHGFRVIE
jgi:hypothetical protein